MYVGGGGRDDRAFIQSTLMGTNKTVSVCLCKSCPASVLLLLLRSQLSRRGCVGNPLLLWGTVIIHRQRDVRPSVSRHHQENIMQISGLCVTHVSSQAAR